jgi:sulfonate transport system substrate-binding protein
MTAVGESEKRINDHPTEVAAALAEDAHIDAAILERALSRGAFGVQPITEPVWREQQRLADTFAELKLLAKIPDVRAAALPPSVAEAERR